VKRRLGLAVAAFIVGALVAGGARARPDDPGDGLFTFDVGDDIETFDTERFRIHYTRAGTHSVPIADDDASGVPDWVEDLGSIYEAALDAYVALGFRGPVSDDGFADNGGDGRFDVYLVDFAFSADGAYRSEVCENGGDVCHGHMVQENDFRGYSYPTPGIGNLTVASHELFHAVQAAYDAGQGAVYAEGTAVWASEQFDATLFDLEGFSDGYLGGADSPLDSQSASPVDPFAYGSSIFFQYLSEQYGTDVVRALVEATKDGAGGVTDPFWFDVIDGVLEREAAVSFEQVFADFARACFFTGRRAVAGLGFEHADDFAEREPEAAELPVAQDRFVLFTSSSRLVRVVARGRSSVQAALVASDPDQLAGLTLRLIARNVDSGAVREQGAVGGAVADAIEVGVDDDIFVLLINARQEGQGGRPRLCVGDPAEVEACVAAVAAEGEGEGEDDDDDDDPTLGGGGCQCGVGPGASAGGASVSLALGSLALLACRRCRRQRRL